MACNCATKEQIEELHRRFGYKVVPTEGQKFSFRVKKNIVDLCVAICVIVLSPLIAAYLLYKAFFTDGKINVPKLMGLTQGNKLNENVRQQQNIQDQD